MVTRVDYLKPSISPSYGFLPYTTYLLRNLVSFSPEIPYPTHLVFTSIFLTHIGIYQRIPGF